MIRLLLLLLLFSGPGLFAQPISWLSDCSPKSFCYNPGSCTEGNVFMTEQAVTNCGSDNINYTYKIDLFNNGGLEIQSSEDTVSGNFPAGTHKIIWRASDNCGNIVQCTYLFQVKDCTPPNLICINGLTQSLDPPLCEATFEVNQFILNLSDNCMPSNQIERGMRIAGTGTGFTNNQSLTFGICDNGLNLLEVWVRDNNGLTNSCSNYVLVQSSDPSCDCNQDADVQFTGCARSANNTRLSSYRVLSTVKSPPGVQPPFGKVKTISTTDSCFTLVVNEIPFDADYQAVIRADKPDAPLNGVTTFDLVLISKHILGLESFTSAYQVEAADVNNSNSVTTFDIVEIRKLILGINDTFTQVPSWRFVRPLPNPANLGSYTAMQDTYQIQLPNLQADLNFQGFSFVGIKYGDINHSAALAGAPDDRTDAVPLPLEATDRWLKAGEEVEIEIRVGEAYTLDGWQIALSADPDALQLVAVSGIPASDYQLTSRHLRAISYEMAGGTSARYEAGDPLFILKVKALQTVRLSQTLSLNEAQMQAEAYMPGARNQTVRRPVLLRFETNELSNIQSCRPAPNPFGSQVDFQVQLVKAAPAQLDIFTLDGRRVYAEKFDLEAGQQSIRLSASTLPEGNLFLYRFAVNGEVVSGKMVRI